MASSTSTSDDPPPSLEESGWSFPLCMDVYKRPKVLPCSHTFCLKDLVKHHPYGSFPCPSCREKTRIPRGGVGAFKTNFYIDFARAKAEKVKHFCEKHKSREVEQYCLQCQVCICLRCMIDDHFHHMTEDIPKTAERLKTILRSDQTVLNNVAGGLKKRLEEFRQEEQAVKDKTEAVKGDILHRHKMMVAVADRCRNEALLSLDTVTASINSRLSCVVKDLQKNLNEVDKQRERVGACLRSEEGGMLLLRFQGIHKDATDRGTILQSLVATELTTVSRPVLRFSASADVTLASERRFLGPVVQVDSEIGTQDVRVKEMFRCSPPTDPIEVFSLFPRADDTVLISYDGQPDRCPEQFDLSGQVIDKTSVRGRTNFMFTSNGTGMSIEQEQGYFSTYAKSRSLLRLKNNLKGAACVIKIIVRSEAPLQTLQAEQFVLKCGAHRAFDVNDRQDLFAVVEEARPGLDPQRKVHLYRRPQGETPLVGQQGESPVATYQPPTQPFQPSDVCFSRLGGLQVLLVADEASDAIHVVSARGGRLEFLRYLAPGCPLLLQPTALNADTRGRLWVACRGGSILICEPINIDGQVGTMPWTPPDSASNFQRLYSDMLAQCNVLHL